MIDALAQAVSAVSDPSHLMFVLLGAALGLLVGILPGMGGTVGVSILLPFVYGMDPFHGVAMLVGVMAATNTGDLFPSVLLGVPGSGASQATILDGYPMAQQGKAATALAAALTASVTGGLIGALLLVVLIFLARPLVLAFGSPELFMLTALGLAVVGVLSRGAPLAGLSAAALGALLGTVGAAETTTEYRYTFGSEYLFGGIPLAILAISLFAVPEFIDLLASKRSIAAQGSVQGSRREGAQAVLKEKWLVLRSCVLGFAIGMLPGLGGSVGQWIVYGAARQTVADASMFGRGDVRGVIAPESANNADNGGSLIPTLAFGIPGNGSTAVFLGGFMLLGLTPGPPMLQGDGLAVTLSIIWSLILASAAGGLIAFIASGWIARLTMVPSQRLLPFVMVTIVVAAYQATNTWSDIVVLLMLGALGWLMKQLRWPRPPLLIGFVLAAPAERYLSISLTRYGSEWLLRPGVLLIGLACVILISSTLFRSRRSAA
jgi:TctA family transporter